MENRKRILWIDNIRGVLFFFVMIYHTFLSPSYFRAVYIPVFLTGFFFLSGYLYRKKENIIDSFISLLNGIVIPYGLFSILLTIWAYISDKSSIFISFYDIFIKGGDVIWFLPCLIIVELLFILIDRLFASQIRDIIIISISAYAFLYIIKDVPHHYYWNFDTSLFAILFFWLGHKYALYQPLSSTVSLFQRSIKVNMGGQLLVYLNFLIYMCVCLFVSKIGIGCENADFHMNNIQNKYVFLFLSIWGCYSLFELFRILPVSPYFAKIGRYTLFMFPFHSYVMRLLMKVVKSSEALEYLYFNFADISIFITCAFGAGVLIIICQICEKYCPWVIGKYKYLTIKIEL